LSERSEPPIWCYALPPVFFFVATNGMPDEWEKRYGLDPSDPSDNSEDSDSNGYTNIEEFLSALIRVSDKP